MARDPKALRWWDGEYWSYVAYKDDGVKAAVEAAEMKRRKTSPPIEWMDRPKNWPERSRT